MEHFLLLQFAQVRTQAPPALEAAYHASELFSVLSQSNGSKPA